MFNVALNGQGFFAIRTPEGVQYTRNGNFSKDNQGRLVDALGNPVLNTQILIPPWIALRLYWTVFRGYLSPGKESV
ncbi:MAG: hypothetical protein EXS58_08470 [Candidatus Latescibacteria bacterium]|nr:hypothetical protein [Candidatus Latescibacterota bacterium]